VALPILSHKTVKERKGVLISGNRAVFWEKREGGGKRESRTNGWKTARTERGHCGGGKVGLCLVFTYGLEVGVFSRWGGVLKRKRGLGVGVVGKVES